MAFNLQTTTMQHPEKKKQRDLQHNEILIILHYKWLWSKADHITDHCSAQLLRETKTQRPSRGLDPAVSIKILPCKYVFIRDLLITWDDVFFHLYCFFFISSNSNPWDCKQAVRKWQKGDLFLSPFREFVEMEEGTCGHIAHGYDSKLGIGNVTKILNCSMINFIITITIYHDLFFWKCSPKIFHT